MMVPTTLGRADRRSVDPRQARHGAAQRVATTTKTAAAWQQFHGQLPHPTLRRRVRVADSAADDMRYRASGLVRVSAPQVLASAVMQMASVRNLCLDTPAVPG